MNSTFSADDVFARWTTAQWDLWDNLATALPTFQPPEDLNLWRESYVNSLSAWETTIQQALEAQRIWLQQWAATMALAVPPGVEPSIWRQQVAEVTDYWLTNQAQLWNQWFALLKAESFVVLPTHLAKTKAVVKPPQSLTQPPLETAADTDLNKVQETISEATPVIEAAETVVVPVADADLGADVAPPPMIEAVSEAAPMIEVAETVVVPVADADLGADTTMSADSVAVAETPSVPSTATPSADSVAVAETPSVPSLEPNCFADAHQIPKPRPLNLPVPDPTLFAAPPQEMPTVPVEKDDLLAIKGVGPKIAKRLQDYGITRYRQIAQLDSGSITRLENHLGTASAGRVLREKWVNQARALHQRKYGEPL